MHEGLAAVSRPPLTPPRPRGFERPVSLSEVLDRVLNKGVVVAGEVVITLADVELVYIRSEEHTSELQSRPHLVCRLLLEKKKNPNPPVRRTSNYELRLSSASSTTLRPSPASARDTRDNGRRRI